MSAVKEKPKKLWANKSSRGSERSIISDGDLKSPWRRITLRVWILIALALLFIAGAGPLLWLTKAATSTSGDILADPFSLWPNGFQLENFANAWTKIKIGRYTWNTAAIAIGVTIVSVLIATTAAYALAILKPAYGKVINYLIMATLFIPGIISLVPLYMVVVEVPFLGISLIDTFWAVWLPGGVSAFNILIVKQYFESLPPELFDAAKVDGAGPLRTFISIVMPMSKPIIGVIALLSFTAAWKDFLWPLLVLPNPDHRPLSVALAYAEKAAPLDLTMAGMMIASILPIILFLVFQNQFLRGAGTAGAIKG